VSAKGKTRPGKNGGRLNTGGTYPGAGRPPKLPDLDKLLADVLGEEKDGRTAAEVILMALRAKAAKGDIRAAEVLLDRAFGKAKQHVDLNTTIPTVVIQYPTDADPTEPQAGEDVRPAEE
jgi:hypothetical protein